MTIVGTRPEIIKLSEIIKKSDKYFDHILVHTGQNYDFELNEIFFNELGIRKPDFFLDSVGNNLGETIGNIISKSYDLIKRESPNAILILGDTNSCLSVLSAKRLKVPVFHLEAGNRCFDENLPEEINRKIVDHISDVNLCYTEHARKYLNFEGVSKERTFVVGSPMFEILNIFDGNIQSSTILKQMNLKRNEYMLLSIHREENIDLDINFDEVINTIQKLTENYDMPIIYSVHPRSRKKIEMRQVSFDSKVILSKPFGFFDYVTLQKNAFCVISDSGTLAEESSYYHFPAVSIRTSTERPEALEKGNFVIGSIDYNSVLQAVDIVTSMNMIGDFGGAVYDYNIPNVSTEVIKIIQSYTEIINRDVWKKNITRGSK